MLVKVCGLCRAQDAAAARAAGADLAGVILSPGHRRSRTAQEAAAVFAAAGTLRRVGVFVDATAAQMERAAAELGLDVLQLHGAETPALAESLRRGGVGVWKALRPLSPAALLAEARAWEGSVDALLLDGGAGTGQPFDWQAVAAVRELLPGVPLLAAGGLSPANVAEAVRVLRPHGVDVSSGVESAPGEKSAEAMRAFVAAARGADGADGAAPAARASHGNNEES